MNSATIKTDFNLKYDPVTFWLEMGGKRYKSLYVHDWMYQMQEAMLIDYLKTIDFHSVLEVGCGFGRITKLLLENFDILDYVAVDMSPDQVWAAREYIKGTPHADDVAFVKGDFSSRNTRMPTYVRKPTRAEKKENPKVVAVSTDELVKFDLVISVEMLMHVLPRDIKYVIRKMMSVSKKHIVNVDWYQDPSELVGKDIAPINFVHDYLKLYGDNCVRIPIRSPLDGRDTKQSIFHITLRE
jgi:SAM-dependent methyltransferase